jgi:hypothetical protein
MARNRVVIETITCDICGQQVNSPITKRLGNDKEVWELDLCENDAATINGAIAGWTANARKPAAEARRPQKAATDDWKYLESLGFTKHRGRKTPAENAALADRS